MRPIDITLSFTYSPNCETYFSSLFQIENYDSLLVHSIELELEEAALDRDDLK